MKLDNKQIFVVDLEANNLYPQVDKIHCLSTCYESSDGWQVKSTTRHEDIIKLSNNENCMVVGHNFIDYDSRAIEKVTGVKPKYSIIDTLLLSQSLFDYRKRHSLDSWAKDEKEGLQKVKVENWEDGDIELYIERCEVDTKLNVNVFFEQYNLLRELYGNDEQDILSYIKYLSFIGELYNEQAANPLTLDVTQAETNRNVLQIQLDYRVDALKSVMPRVPIKTKKAKPKKCFKKDGTLSATGKKWFDLLEEFGLPRDHEDTVHYINGYNDPNPQSPAQVKSWLLEKLNWKPCTFKDSISTLGEKKKVPQLKDKDKNLVPSILRLVKTNPQLEALEDLSVIQHRLGYLKGFLDNQVDGKIAANKNKVTATLRVGHKTIVNLPSVHAAYGQHIRSVLTCDEGYILCGSDISSLENYVAANLTYTYKPEILDQLNDPNFDTHLELARFADMISEEDIDWYKKNSKRKDLSKDDNEKVDKIYEIRNNAKTVNYSALFGIGQKALSVSLGTTVGKAKKLLDGFWAMNKHVQDYVARDVKRKVTMDERKWAQSPISGFWLPVRSEHKVFNVIVQSTGAYIHNMWMSNVRKKGYKISLSMHDELLIILPDNEEAKAKLEADLIQSMEEVNDSLQLVARISIDTKFGKCYSDTH